MLAPGGLRCAPGWSDRSTPRWEDRRQGGRPRLEGEHARPCRRKAAAEGCRQGGGRRSPTGARAGIRPSGGHRRGRSPAAARRGGGHGSLLRRCATRPGAGEAQSRSPRLGKMQRELVEVAAVARRSFHLWRLVRDRQDAWVSRVAPLLAAKFNISEGDFWRALKGEVRKLQEELAGLDIAARRRWGSWPRRRRSSGASWPSCRAFRAPHLVGRRYACRSHSPARSPRSP